MIKDAEHQTPLRTNTGALVHFKIVTTERTDVRAYTVTFKDYHVRTIEAECVRLIKAAFPDHDGTVALPTECGAHGWTITGKAAGLPKFTDTYGKECLGPMNGNVRLDGVLKPVLRDGRAGVLFIVREVVAMPSTTLRHKPRRTAQNKTAPAKPKTKSKAKTARPSATVIPFPISATRH